MLPFAAVLAFASARAKRGTVLCRWVALLGVVVGLSWLTLGHAAPVRLAAFVGAAAASLPAQGDPIPALFAERGDLGSLAAPEPDGKGPAQPTSPGARLGRDRTAKELHAIEEPHPPGATRRRATPHAVRAPPSR